MDIGARITVAVLCDTRCLPMFLSFSFSDVRHISSWANSASDNTRGTEKLFTVSLIITIAISFEFEFLYALE